MNVQFLWKLFLVRDLKIPYRDPSWFHQLAYVYPSYVYPTLVKLSKSPQQVCNAGIFFSVSLADSPHTHCICPGIFSPSVHYIVCPYLQEIICLQASSYTDPLTPVLKAGIVFAALLSSGTEEVLNEDLHTAFRVSAISSQNSLQTFFSEYCLVLLTS